MNSTVSVVYYIILLIITELIKILIKSSLYFQLSLYFLQSFFFPIWSRQYKNMWLQITAI